MAAARLRLWLTGLSVILVLAELGLALYSATWFLQHSRPLGQILNTYANVILALGITALLLSEAVRVYG